jgi:hypothetical protein
MKSVYRVLIVDRTAPDNTPVGLFGDPGETQTLGKVLAATFRYNEGPNDELACRRLELNRQALRHQLPGVFGNAKLGEASRHLGRRGGVL